MTEEINKFPLKLEDEKKDNERDKDTEEINKFNFKFLFINFLVFLTRKVKDDEKEYIERDEETEEFNKFYLKLSFIHLSVS